MDVFMGTIMPFGFQFTPRGWQPCNGQTMPISQNSAMYSLLGTTFGGDGQTTYGLPDLRGRVGISQGQGPGLSPYTMGEKAGTETVTLTSGQMPMHNHGLTASTAAATATAPGATELLAAPNGEDANLGAVTVKMYAPAGGAMVALSPTSTTVSGSSQPFSIMQPFLVLNYQIAMEGIFPSRN